MDSSGILWLGSMLPVLQLIPGTVGWGKDGHYATCKITEGFLTEEALAGVKSLLPDYAEGELANVCSWPDEIWHSYRWHWSGPLHTLMCTILFAITTIAESQHCWDKDVPVAGAIHNYTKQLASTYYDPSPEVKYNLTEALLFLSHFIGDVHQPLHVGFTGDEGGNTKIVRWYRRKANLHHVWDNMIIDSALKMFYSSDISNMIQAIQRNITMDTFYLIANSGETTSRR